MSRIKLKDLITEQSWLSDITGAAKGWAKDFYYSVWQDEGKVGYYSYKGGWKNFDEAYEDAKRKGYKYFKWLDKYYSVAYDGSIEEESLVYKPTNLLGKMQTPWRIQVNMWLPAEHPNMLPGHIEAVCLNDRKVQVNPWDKTNTIGAKLTSTPKSGNYWNRIVSKGRPGSGGRYIIVYLTNKEYANFKKIAGNVTRAINKKIATDVLKGRAKKEGSDLIYSQITYYNLLTQNCADGVAAAFGVSSTASKFSFMKLIGIPKGIKSPLVSIVNIGNTLGIGTPETTYKNIKDAFPGRYIES